MEKVKKQQNKTKTKKRTRKPAKFYFATFEVTAADAKNIYLCGDSKNLGNWNPQKSAEVKQSGNGKFFCRKRFLIGQVVEFKFLRSKSWMDVEKGTTFGEEIPNRKIDDKNKTVVVEIVNWRQE